MAFFLPKHSSAATARLTQDRHHQPLKPPRSPGQHRRLESEAPESNWFREDDRSGDGCDQQQREEALSDGPTKSTSFSSSDSGEDSSEEDEDRSSSDGGYDGSSSDGDDGRSLTSGGSLDREMMVGLEYDDGDLRTLDQLVNKLHAAELRRERESKAPERRARAQSADDYSPSVLPPDLGAPRFSPLHSSHRLSISAVDSWRGPSLEIVPTASVEDILPAWNSEWTRDRQEWEDRRRASHGKEPGLKRSRTASDAHGMLPGAIGLHHRNHSLPGCRRSGPKAGDVLSVSSSTHRHYKYGRPPTLPGAKEPNPMVSKSSKKIHRKHARYALTAGMMLGIRESVGGALGVEAELEISNWEGWESKWREDEEEDRLSSSAGETEDGRSLSQDSALRRSSSPGRPGNISSRALSAYTTLTTECERVAKYKFPPHKFNLGCNTSRPLPHKYKFKVYAPLVFARIRTLFGVEKQTFLHSICGKFNFYEFASNARSGQFFFYSHDGRYMIKTLTYTESKFLREILPHYYRHLTRHPSTFLTHFYGMYRVCMPDANNQRLHFIIMRSVFHTEKKIDRVWDLKGSRAGRKANEGDSVQKDLDILEEGRRLRFAEPKARAAFLEQLARDATFLARLGIMDYSLLLGLHNREEEGGEGVEGAPKAGADNPYETPRDGNRKSFFGKKEEPERSNTPFRRGIMQRASSAGDTKVGNDGFKALEVAGESAPKAVAGDSGAGVSPPALRAIPESPVPPPVVKRRSSVPPSNAITLREDGGIEGYGVRLEDGTLAKREIYFCGIIDILQYYNARKIGETVLRKAAGNSGQDISCVDPETYGKRFVKFISKLVEE